MKNNNEKNRYKPKNLFSSFFFGLLFFCFEANLEHIVAIWLYLFLCYFVYFTRREYLHVGHTNENIYRGR